MPEKKMVWCEAKTQFNGHPEGSAFEAAEADAAKWEGMGYCKKITAKEAKALMAPPVRKDIQAPPQDKGGAGADQETQDDQGEDK